MTGLVETVVLLRDLIAFPTVSADPNLAMIDYLSDRLEAAGAEIMIQRDAEGRKANLIARFGPEAPGGLLLSGHTDVVPVDEQVWSTDPFTLTEADGRFYGRGTCDMKGFIAACVALAPRFAEARREPVYMAFTHDEEVGCLGARHLTAALPDLGITPRMAVIGEPTEMRLVEGHKGCCEYTVRMQGLAGHGSAPDLGVNAVEVALSYVARLQELREVLKARAPEGGRFDPPWTTINIGALHGGVAHNVIAGHAVLDWEMRPVQPGDAEFVKADLARLVEGTLLPRMRARHPDSFIETEVIGEVAGLVPVPDNPARDLVARITGANGADVVAFGTEAGLFQAAGMSAVICGPGSIAQAHKPDEFVALSELERCLDLLHGLADAVT